MQQLLPLAGQLDCEQCFKPVTHALAAKSKDRCQGHVLCFSHQMFYTSRLLRQKRLAQKQVSIQSQHQVA